MNHKYMTLILAILLIFLGYSFIDNNKIRRIARAIAKAEGFGPMKNIPTRANNPGDLGNGDIGYGTIDGKTIYGSIQDGWDALYTQVTIMLTGQSRFYQPYMTLREVAEVYTGHDKADDWAVNVARALGISPDSQLGGVI